jgi:hypothetical protein
VALSGALRVLINLFVATVVNNYVRIKDEEKYGLDEASAMM